MSFKKINELRKAGKLEEALTLVHQALEADPDNIWNRKAAAWVYYDFLKKYGSPDKLDEFISTLSQIEQLNLPDNENVFFESCANKVGSMLFKFDPQKFIDYNKIDKIFEIIKSFHFPKPSAQYSFLFKAFHRIYKDHSNYIAFADWWNFDYFMNEDYSKSELNDKKIMSLVEQAYIAYSKQLLKGEFVSNTETRKIIDIEKIKLFMPRLDKMIDTHPEYIYLPYYKAKLLIELGDTNNSLNAFLPFARKKKKDFWVWDILAEIYQSNDEIQFACYCKALTINAPEEYLINVREKLVQILLSKRMYDEAKTEIENIISTRKKNNWKLPYRVRQWLLEFWYDTATAKADNRNLYLSYAPKAEELIYQDIPEEIVVVEYVNKEKNVLNFIKDKNKHGFFRYNGWLTNPQTGDILLVRFNEEVRENFYKILTAKRADPDTPSDALKNFEGSLKLIPNKNIGFIDDIFIDPHIIKANQLKDGQSVKGKAILSFDHTKKKWGWKAIRIESK
ncbi:MAG: tetratricopeptide repeat protein [Bacteroidales bacterium]|nr:tetratricopeptide repeat protein [Bacteroidales bacterium]